jgi:hypothetical protein
MKFSVAVFGFEIAGDDVIAGDHWQRHPHSGSCSLRSLSFRQVRILDGRR